MKQVFICLLLLAVLAVAQTSSSNSKVSAVREAYIAAYNAKQADKVADIYAQDAVLIMPAGTLDGRDAIRAQLQKDFASGATDLQVVNMKSGGDADVQWESGDFSQKVNGKEVKGHYLVTLKMVQGNWQIVALANVPVLPAPPAQ
jgi:uncharacterized protein (TIGR02246 family)